MSEPLTTAGRSDHGAPDPLPPPVMQLCHRCKGPTRATQTIAGHDYCDVCAQHIRDLDAFHALIGTGEP